MAGIRDIAKSAGLKVEDVVDVFEAVFQLAKSGEQVRVSGFGTFEKKKFPGRTLKSPVINDGEETTYGPSYRISFKSSEQCKRRLNRRSKANKAQSSKKQKKKSKKGKRK